MEATSVSTRPSPTPLLAAVAIAGALGFWAGRFSVSTPRSIAGERDGKATASAAGGARSASRASGAAPGSAANEADSDSNASLRAPPWSKEGWDRLASAPGSRVTFTALSTLLEGRAATEPAQALALAQAEKNLELRELLVHAALRGWARVAPEDAANWALALPTANARENALSAVFAGTVAANADAAMRLGQSLLQRFPDDAPNFGARLIDAFCASDNFEMATRFAVLGSPDMRAGWIANAYSKWAEFQPEAAGRAAAALESPELRNQALHGIVGGWAAVDPVGLVSFVLKLPADGERGAILSQALESWVRHDSKNAAAWIDQNESRPELDRGIAAVATMDGVKSDVALSWAESITNPALRSETLVTVLRNWMTTDAAGARNYFKSSTNLSPEDRQQLEDVFAGMERHAKP